MYVLALDTYRVCKNKSNQRETYASYGGTRVDFRPVEENT